MLNPDLLKLIVCPVSKQPLLYQKELNELWSREAGLAYEVKDGIPVLIAAEARVLSENEITQMNEDE